MKAQAQVEKNANAQVNQVQSGNKATPASDSAAKNEQMTQNVEEVQLTDSEVASALKYNNNTKNVPKAEIPGICKIVGVSERDSFDEELVRAVANWQARNHIDADGKYGNTSRTFGARQDYQEYIDGAGLDNIVQMLSDALQNEFSAGMARIDAKYDLIDRIAKEADVPPEMVGAIWYREASVADGVYLHNGQPLGQPTDLEPKGISFGVDEFEEAAIHALKSKGSMIHALGLNYGSLDFAAMCAYTEGYNGWGYRMYHPAIASAYVNSGTTNYTSGKYVADGHFDEDFVDGQVGTLPIMLETLKRHPRTGSGGGAKTNGDKKNTEKTATGAKEPTAADTPEATEQTPTEEPQAAVTVNIDVKRAIRVNKSYGYSIKVWREIQSGVGLKGSDVDGIVGSTTSRKIAEWQTTHGFTEDDIDGICGPKTLSALRSNTTAQAPISSAAANAGTATGHSHGNEAAKEPAQEHTDASDAPVGQSTGAEQSSSGLLSAANAASAAEWNNKRNYSDETISQIKSTVSGSSGNSFDADDAQKIASWQQNQGLTGTDVDGKFGNTSCGIAGITPSYNISDTHTLGSDTPNWCTLHGFINGTTLDTLKDNFKTTAEAVIGGIESAGGSVNVTSTLRHPARAAVMYYARYQKKTSQVQDIFNEYGISVNNDNGDHYAAQVAFGIQGNAVGLNSNHIYGHAVDMIINRLPSSINVNGVTVNTGGDRGNYEDNAQALDNALQSSGAVSEFKWYGDGDEVHWSTTGR